MKYGSIIRRYVKARDIGGVPLRNLTAAHFNALYAQLQAEGLSVATRRSTHAVLRGAMNDAVRWGRLARNPVTAADPPALPRSRAQSWSDRELRAFLEGVMDDRLFALWRLAATTAMRRGELLGLPWRCVDLDAARLRVERQLVPTKGVVTFGPPKSRRSERTIALDPETVDALRRHRDVQRLERDVAGPAYEDHDLVSCDELGRPIYPRRHLRDDRAHRGHSAARRGRPAWGRPENGALHLRPPAPALGRGGRRRRRSRTFR